MKTNKITMWMIFGLFSALVNSLFAQSLYRWVDEEGNIHYSDKIPAESTKQAHSKISKQGVILEQERSEEEIKKDALLAKESEDKRKLESIQKAKQRRLDRILLDTFTTEKDLLLTRDERLNMIDSIVNLTISNNQIISKQIKTTKTQIEFLESQSREVPENTRKKLENLIGQKEKNLVYIAAKKKEREQLKEQFAMDLARFRVLRNKGGDESDESDQSVPTIPAVKPTKQVENAAATKNEASKQTVGIEKDS